MPRPCEFSYEDNVNRKWSYGKQDGYMRPVCLYKQTNKQATIVTIL